MNYLSNPGLQVVSASNVYLLNLLFVSGSSPTALIQHNDLDTSSLVLTAPNTSIDNSYCIWGSHLPVGDEQAQTCFSFC